MSLVMWRYPINTRIVFNFKILDQPRYARAYLQRITKFYQDKFKCNYVMSSPIWYNLQLSSGGTRGEGREAKGRGGAD